MKLARLPPFAARSSAITGIPASLAFWTDGTMASESVGFTRMTSSRWVMKFAIWSACFALSLTASTTTSSAPAWSAALWAPFRRLTKKGLFSVDSASPIFFPGALPMAGAAAGLAAGLRAGAGLGPVVGPTAGDGAGREAVVGVGAPPGPPPQAASDRATTAVAAETRMLRRDLLIRATSALYLYVS